MVADVLAKGVDPGVFTRDMTRVPMVKFSTGGDAFNQAVNLSAMGCKVRLLGKVGTDAIASFLVGEAQLKGIDVSLVKRDPDHQTSVTIVLIGENGERNFIGCKEGTNSYLTGTDIDTSKFTESKIVSLGSIYGSISLTGSVVAPIMQEAKAKGCITVADMMHAERGSLEDVAEVLPFIDYFIPSEKEAQLLTKEDDVSKAAEVLLSKGAKNVVIKMGEKGCYIRTSKDALTVQAYPTTPVDTTGAGDAFVSGFITGLLDNLPIAECAKRGCAAGSITVRSVGATGGITSKQQILELLS